jgi:hypothetical protein
MIIGREVRPKLTTRFPSAAAARERRGRRRRRRDGSQSDRGATPSSIASAAAVASGFFVAGVSASRPGAWRWLRGAGR